MLKKSVLFITMIAALGLSMPAFATVTNWDYSITAAFQDSVFVNAADPIGLLVGEHDIFSDKLIWGKDISVAQSSLEIEATPVGGNVDTYLDGGVPGSTYWGYSIELTHNNQPIPGNSDILFSTVLHTTVTLDPTTYDPDHADNPPLPPQPFNFDIKFIETSNSNVSPYDGDIFALVGGFPNFTFSYDDDGSGTNPAQDYFINLFPSDGSVLAELDATAAALAGVPTGTMGFITEEDHSTSLPFAFTISTERIPNNVVPEPTTLLLFGCGLLGLGFYSRRRKM